MLPVSVQPSPAPCSHLILFPACVIYSAGYSHCREQAGSGSHRAALGPLGPWYSAPHLLEAALASNHRLCFRTRAGWYKTRLKRGQIPFLTINLLNKQPSWRMVSQFWCRDYLGKANQHELGSHWPARTDCRREKLGSCMARDTIHCPARASWEAPKHSAARPPGNYKVIPPAASTPHPPASAPQDCGHSFHRAQLTAPGPTAETYGVCGYPVPSTRGLWLCSHPLSQEHPHSASRALTPHFSCKPHLRSGDAAVNPTQGILPHMERPMQLRSRFPGFNPT